MEEKKEQEPIFMKHTVEQGISEYNQIMGQFEEIFFDLEKTKPIDLSGIYVILPSSTRLKKKSILWAFSIAKNCKSKVYIAVKRTKKRDQQIDKISKFMNVEYEFIEGEIDKIMEDIKKERNLIVLPRDIIEGIEEEIQQAPLLII